LSDEFVAFESESNTMGVFIWTNRNDFYSIWINSSLFQTKSAPYYKSPNVPDVNCQIGTLFSYEFKIETFQGFQMDSFQEVSADLINYKYAYKEFPDVCCPLSTYNITFTLLNSLFVNEETISSFETGK